MTWLNRLTSSNGNINVAKAKAILPGQALPPAEMYRLLDAYYQNNGLYSQLAELMYDQNIWYPAMKSLRNPAYRTVEFYPTHIWPGMLPEALPIATENEAILDPIYQVWKWSNWGARKQLAARQIAKYGDLFIKVAQSERRDQVYFQLIEPQYVNDFDEDHRDFTTFIRIDIPSTRRDEGGREERYTHTEVWSKDQQSYRVWQHKQGRRAALGQLGPPMLERVLAEGQGEEFAGIDFVPFIHAKFRDIGEERGVGAFTLALEKVDEVNLKVTRLAQLIFRYNKAIWALRANQQDHQGRPVAAPLFSGKDKDGDVIAIEDDQLFRLPGHSSLESLIPNINYSAHMEAIAADLEEIEADLPELTYYRLKETGNLSGRALQLLLAPAIAKVKEARGNAETALARANQMALSVGANAGLFSDIGSYEAGDFEHSFETRDVLPLSESEEAATGKIFYDMGVPRKTVLRRLGWSESDLKQMDQDMAEQQAAEQTSLASATLEAMRQFDGGQQETGLSQPGAAAEAEPPVEADEEPVVDDDG